MKDLHAVHRLVDIWRRKFCKSIGTRLDKFFIAQDLTDHTTHCEISPGPFSNPDSVELLFDLPNVFSHGPGIWRLHLDLLEDENFVLRSQNLFENISFIKKPFCPYMIGGTFLKTQLKSQHRISVGINNVD